MLNISKKILYFLISALLLVILFFLVDLADIDNNYVNRNVIEIDSKNLNSRHSFKISTYLRYYYLKAYKIVNYESYKKRWEIEDQNIRNSFPEKKIVKAKNSDYSNQLYSLDEYSTSNNWHRSHGNNFSTRFSNFNIINNENAKNLKLAWVYSPEDEKNFINNVQANPIFYNGNILLPNSQNQIVSLDGLTGKQNWKFDVDKGIAAKRGMIIYDSDKYKNEPRIFFVNNRNRLFSLNANTGKPISKFGKNGEVEIGLTPIPPVIYKNQLIIITTSSILKVYDLNTGKLKWKYKINKTKNSILFPNFEKGSPWGGFSLDEKRGLLFFTTGNPEEWHVGVDRPGDNLYANSVVAFNLEEKKIEWHFQEIQHDIWNLDIAAAPILTMVKKNDQYIDVVVAVTKLGNTLVLDRESGEPLFDIIKRRAPISNVPGERTSPYQIDLSIPEPVCRNKFKKEYLSDSLDEDDTQKLLSLINNSDFGFPSPPKIGKKNIQMAGCVRWAGASIDTEQNILYVSVDQFPYISTIIENKNFKGKYTHKWEYFVDKKNNPGIKPPWGAIVALDLNLGKIKWKVPFGNFNELKNIYNNDTGTTNRSGVTASRGNLIFASGTKDKKFRVFDSNNGNKLWSYTMSNAGSAPPTVYEINGKQFIVVPAFENGGKKIYSFTLK